MKTDPSAAGAAASPVRGLGQARIAHPNRRFVFAGLVLAIALAGGLLLFRWAAPPDICPVTLTRLGMEPSGISGDNGAEFQLVTFGLSNRSDGRLTFAQEGITAEAKVGQKWVAAGPVSNVLEVEVGQRRDMTVLMPPEAEGCRLRITYLPEPLKLRFVRWCVTHGAWRHAWSSALMSRCIPRKWFQPVRSDYVGRRKWMRSSAEIYFQRLNSRLWPTRPNASNLSPGLSLGLRSEGQARPAATSVPA
ncbi:MAG TPA: hypothetical protein VHI52_04520 [Verrucomicrobiae bacterium]|nr:hypothetical protein [Verrucomicrobiae bacterium]